MEVGGVVAVAAAAAVVAAAAASPCASGEEGNGGCHVHQRMPGFDSTGLVGVVLGHQGQTWHNSLGSMCQNAGLCIW